ncbi:DUF1624 domain-containing protein [Parasediminibacterium paludis]|uniref:DUF1624 domain-containing protein n=1 Tax=Parasediminibacterium paludis TaxID=908966 RepID=A0ABV8PWE9_9BACT
MATPTAHVKRIESIDILRGLVMIIMALDHLRDYLHIDANLHDPLDLLATTPILFFTRWITHFCAPVFVFLSGASIYLQSLRKTKKELSIFLLKRGLWLVFAEIFIVSFGVTFIPFYNFLFLQVIWAIGISMIVLGLVVHLRFEVILGIGLAIVLGHNLLDFPEAAVGFKPNLLWEFLHKGGIEKIFGITVFMFYPFVPWLGLMMLGYCTGIFFTSKFSVEQRKKILLQLGFGLIATFVIVRFINVYGDPLPWAKQQQPFYTFLSFIKVQKYPPSLLYMCITIGPALLFLASIEKVQNGVTDVLRTYGRTAFFYYLLHFYLAHIICGVAFFLRGHTWHQAFEAAKAFPFLFQIGGEGYSLTVVYIVWICLVASLYPLCKWYDGYKTSHKEKRWLSYL